MTKEEKRIERSIRRALQKRPSRPQVPKGPPEAEDKDKSFIAVRWPSTLKKPLKVAAAGNDPPLTMTEYLAKCFHEIQDEGGLGKRKSPSGTAAEIPVRNDKERRKRYQEASEKLFRTNDRRLIDSIISLLGHTTKA
jgi:hypothetical protein